MQNNMLYIVAGIAGLFFWANKSRATTAPLIGVSPMQSIGERYNNPLNIKYNPANNWVGQDTAKSGEFVYFKSPEYGYRAAFVLLNNYQKMGFNTLTKVINRWAPESDNNPTQNYIYYVSNKTGLFPDTPIKPQDYQDILAAMATFEQGRAPDMAALMTGYQLAFG